MDHGPWYVRCKNSFSVGLLRAVLPSGPLLRASLSLESHWRGTGQHAGCGEISIISISIMVGGNKNTFNSVNYQCFQDMYGPSMVINKDFHLQFHTFTFTLSISIRICTGRIWWSRKTRDQIGSRWSSSISRRWEEGKYHNQKKFYYISVVLYCQLFEEGEGGHKIRNLWTDINL